MGSVWLQERCQGCRSVGVLLLLDLSEFGEEGVSPLFGGALLGERQLAADVEEVDELLSLGVEPRNFLFLHCPVHVIAGDVLETGGGAGIGEHKVDSVGDEHAVGLVDHAGHVGDGVIAAHKGVDGGLVQHEVEAGVGIGHSAYVLHLKEHLVVAALGLDLVHLRNDHARDVDVGDAVVARLVEPVLQGAVAAAQLQDARGLVEVDCLFDLGLRALQIYLQILEGLEPLEALALPLRVPLVPVEVLPVIDGRLLAALLLRVRHPPTSTFADYNTPLQRYYLGVHR